MDKSLLHIEILQVINLPVFNVILHAADGQLLLLRSQNRYGLLILGLDAISQPRYSKLELPDPGVDDVERIVGVIVGIHLKLDESGGD